MELGKNMDCKIDGFRRWLNHFGIKTLQNEDQNGADDDGGSWENLPKDIMETIFLHLNSTDYIHSSVVCKSWRSLLLQSDILRPQTPWLLLPHHPSRHNIKFYNVLEDKYHTFMLPKGDDGGRVVGCSKGWVIFITKSIFKIYIFNPISNARYLLPLLSTTTLPLRRVELSSPDILDCTVAAIFDNFEKLALCRLGDERWEVLLFSSGVGQDRTLIDIMFCHQKLYVLIDSEIGNAGKIENIVTKLPNHSKTIPITLIHDIKYFNSDLIEIAQMPPPITFRIFSRHSHISYLVESIKGQAILVQKHLSTFYIQQNEEVNAVHQNLNIINNNEDSDDDEVEEDDDDEDNNNNHEEEEEIDVTLKKHLLSNLDGFKIYEIEDLVRKKRICKDLGKEQALFLSSKSRLCLPAASNELQGNCVHFMMERVNTGDDYESFWMGTNGIYHLDDFTIETLIPKFELYWNPEFTWFTPNL